MSDIVPERGPGQLPSQFVTLPFSTPLKRATAVAVDSSGDFEGVTEWVATIDPVGNNDAMFQESVNTPWGVVASIMEGYDGTAVPLITDPANFLAPAVNVFLFGSPPNRKIPAVGKAFHLLGTSIKLAVFRLSNGTKDASLVIAIRPGQIVRRKDTRECSMTAGTPALAQGTIVAIPRRAVSFKALPEGTPDPGDAVTFLRADGTVIESITGPLSDHFYPFPDEALFLAYKNADVARNGQTVYWQFEVES